MKTTTITILLFSSLRERVGTSTLELKLSAASPRISDAFDRLCSDYPAVRPYRDYIRVAANGDYSDWSTPVSEGDQIAFITPVSGG